MKSHASGFWSACLTVMTIGALVIAAPAAAPAITTYGTLDNFDVYNDTGGAVYGFEIELEGLGSSDVAYTFGAPYIRYGDPKTVPYAGGVYVRYQSPWDGSTFTATTPIPGSMVSTSGHDCYNASGVGDYGTSGCEHFGVSLNASPTKTTYRWLVKDPSTPGGLLAFGTNVKLPAPAVTVTPPAPGGAAPQVQAAVQAPAAPPPLPGTEPQWGEAIWVVLYKTEVPQHAELEDLVGGDPVIQAMLGEAPEIEWWLLQSAPAGEDELSEGAELGAAAEDGAVIRRYEFYRYVGLYNTETHEALCDNQAVCPDAVGDFIGSQMVAVNFLGFEPILAGPQVPEPSALLLLATGLAGLAGAARRKRRSR